MGSRVPWAAAWMALRAPQVAAWPCDPRVVETMAMRIAIPVAYPIEPEPGCARERTGSQMPRRLASPHSNPKPGQQCAPWCRPQADVDFARRPARADHIMRGDLPLRNASG